jgi:hypothetical protein
MLLIALSSTLERQAHAYVDPGSGLLIFQGLSAAFSGALFYFRRTLKKVFVKSSKGIRNPTAHCSPSILEEKFLIAFLQPTGATTCVMI